MKQSLDAARLAERFERERPRLVRMAYRMLGSLMDAEDVVQDGWLRFTAAASGEGPAAAPEDDAAWLTRTVSRLALDALRRRRRRAYAGPWLPEPVVASTDAIAEDAERLSIGMLTLLETLTPLQRAALVLRDVFGDDHRSIGEALGVREDAARQHCARARRRLETTAPVDGADLAARAPLLDALAAALLSADRTRLLELLHPDAVALHDGGGRVAAAIRPIETAARIVQVYLHLAQQFPGAVEIHRLTLLGDPALALVADGRLQVLNTLSVERGRIIQLHGHRHPDKLARIAAHLGVASTD